VTSSDIAIAVAALLAAFGVGTVFGGSSMAWLIALVLFASMAVVMVQTKMRAVVAVPVLLGGFVGVLAGTATVQAMCLPGTCEAIANTAGIVTGIGGIVGVGLVVALTVRSFDEYRTAIAAGRPPPTVGCETDELS
jgi:hypothetical protein